MAKNTLIQIDPKSTQQKSLANAMAGNALKTSPVGHWTQALARIMQGYVGGQINQNVASEEERRQADAQQTLQQALAGYRGDTTTPISAPLTGMAESRPQVANLDMNIPGQGQDVGELMRVLAGNPDTAHLATDLQMSQVEAGMKPKTTNLQEIYDPSSPTGTRYVSRETALGQPGKMPSGMDMQFGPDGRLIRMSTGRKGAGGADSNLSTATVNKIQKKQLDAQEGMARLDNIQALYEPRFQQIPTRLGMKWTSLKSKFDVGEVAPQDMTDLYDYSMYQATSLENLNRLLNELSGAAVSPQEFTRIAATMPKVGEGIFDGDDPISFQSKLDRAMTDTKRSLMRYKYMTGKNEDPLSMPLWQIDDVIQKRGEELEQQYGGMQDADEIINRQLKQEFLM